MEVGSHWKLLSQGVAWSELLWPESRSFWPLAAVFIFHSLGSPRFFLVWLFIYLSCLFPCHPPLLLPAPSLSPISSGLILILAVPAGEDGFPWLVPTWCPKEDSTWAALVCPLLGTSGYSYLLFGTAYKQVTASRCDLSSYIFPQVSLNDWQIKAVVIVVVFLSDKHMCRFVW